MSASRNERWGEWRKHWTLVLACAFGVAFSSVVAYSFGLFLEPMGDEFGWGRAQLSVGLTISAAVSVLLSPIAGSFIDRLGVRRLALPGLFLLMISTASFALANGSMVRWVALWVIFALIDLAVKTTVWTTAVAGTFDKERSLAIAFTLGGVSLSQIVGPPLTQALIAEFGWRMTFVFLGVGWGSIALLLSFFFLYDVRDRNRRDGQDKAAATANPVAGLTLRKAMVNGPLIRIAVATFITMVLGLAVLLNQVPILTSGGISRANAAYIASLGGLAGIAGKITTGWLMDRKDAALVGAAILAISAVAYGLLLDSVRTVPLAITAIMVTGFASATKMQICAYMTSRYAGMLNFGTVFGFMASLIGLGGALGPFLANVVWDHFGTYDPILAASVIGTLIAAALIADLRRYPIPEHPQPVLSPA
jgi:predicted MFS family arabinose efflux permease